MLQCVITYSSPGKSRPEKMISSKMALEDLVEDGIEALVGVKEGCVGIFVRVGRVAGWVTSRMGRNKKSSRHIHRNNRSSILISNIETEPPFIYNPCSRFVNRGTMAFLNTATQKHTHHLSTEQSIASAITSLPTQLPLPTLPHHKPTQEKQHAQFIILPKPNHTNAQTKPSIPHTPTSLPPPNQRIRNSVFLARIRFQYILRLRHTLSHIHSYSDDLLGIY